MKVIGLGRQRFVNTGRTHLTKCLLLGKCWVLRERISLLGDGRSMFAPGALGLSFERRESGGIVRSPYLDDGPSVRASFWPSKNVPKMDWEDGIDAENWLPSGVQPSTRQQWRLRLDSAEQRFAWGCRRSRGLKIQASSFIRVERHVCRRSVFV